MKRKSYKFDSSPTISSSLSIVFIMALSLWVAWMVVRKAGETIASAKVNPAFNIQRRINN
jgi:hypothetical protein